MKKIFLFVFLLCSLISRAQYDSMLLASKQQFQNSDPDPLQPSNFYGDLAGSKAFPNSTNQGDWANFSGGVYSLETSDTRTGSTAIRVTGTGGGVNTEIYNTPIMSGATNGVTYVMSGWIKVVTPNTVGNIQGQFYDYGGSHTYSNVIDNTNTDDWQYFYVEKTKGASAIELVIFSRDGVILVDDIQVYIKP